jgi:hypothetical protein
MECRAILCSEMKRVTPLKIAIVTSGRAQKDIAAAVGVDPTHFSRIVNGLHCDEAMQKRIAEELGRQIPELFPPAAEAAA